MNSQIKHHTARLRELLKHLLSPKFYLKLSKLPQLEWLFGSTESWLRILHFHYHYPLKKKSYDRLKLGEKLALYPLS